MPLGVSVFLHIILLIALSVNVSTQNRYQSNDQNRPIPVINAIAVDQQPFDKKIKKNQQIEEKQCITEKNRKEKLQQQVLSLKEQRITEQKQLLSMRAKQLQLKQKQEREVASRKKTLATKKQKQKILAKMQQRLQKKLLQQEIAQEKSLLAAKAQQMAQTQDIFNQYKAQIIQAIEQQWIVPANVNNLSCILLIRLTPGGNILSVETVRSSGDAVLDRSARMAVFAASPLPVPKNMTDFSKFRELRLTVRPLQVKQSSTLHKG